MMALKSDRSESVLEGCVGKDSPCKMCHADILTPQKTPCCYEMKRCFNKASLVCINRKLLVARVGVRVDAS